MPSYTEEDVLGFPVGTVVRPVAVRWTLEKIHITTTANPNPRWDEIRTRDAFTRYRGVPVYDVTWWANRRGTTIQFPLDIIAKLEAYDENLLEVRGTV